MRIERGLKQAGLGRMLRPPPGQTWVSAVERDKFRPGFEELGQLAEALSVAPLYILQGEAAGLSEFMQRIIGVERLLDDRARRTVLAVVDSEASHHEDWEHPGVAMPRAADEPAPHEAPRRGRRWRGGRVA